MKLLKTRDVPLFNNFHQNQDIQEFFLYFKSKSLRLGEENLQDSEELGQKLSCFCYHGTERQPFIGLSQRTKDRKICEPLYLCLQAPDRRQIFV